jgi:hypothetical protein
MSWGARPAPHTPRNRVWVRMQKFFLISIMIMTIAIPMQTSREKNRALALKNTIKWMAVYCAFYLFHLLYIYPRLEGH